MNSARNLLNRHRKRNSFVAVADKNGRGDVIDRCQIRLFPAEPTVVHGGGRRIARRSTLHPGGSTEGRRRRFEAEDAPRERRRCRAYCPPQSHRHAALFPR